MISAIWVFGCGSTDDPDVNTDANADRDANTSIDASNSPDGAAGVDAPPGATSKVVFVSSSTQNADFGGLGGADTVCNNLASAAGLSGTFIAWMSIPGTNAADRLTITDLPFVRTDGTTVADNLADLVDGSIADRINRDENGTARGGDVWTGTLSDGTVSGVTCGSFDTTGGTGQCGDTGAMNGAWTQNTTPSCATTLRLYCIEQ